MIVVVIAVAASFSLEGLLTKALNARFEKSLAAEVYELKFKKLDVNPFTGHMVIIEAEIFPRHPSRKQYSYINSQFSLTARKIVLQNVNLIKLIRGNEFDLDKIEILEPDIDFTISNHKLVFFPFREDPMDSLNMDLEQVRLSFVIKKLDLINAHFHIINQDSSREGDLKGINLSWSEITIQREQERDKIAYQHFDFSFDTLRASLKKSDLRDFQLHNFMIRVDSLYFEQTPDTVIYHFSDAITSGHHLDIQTADSIFNIALDSFYLHYKDRSMVLSNVSYKPNISEVAVQKSYPYRKEVFNVVADSIHVHGMNFDSLLHRNKIQVKEIILDSVSGAIYKDLTKPFPPNHQPKYLAQQVQEYTMGVLIEHIQVTNANLVNTEVKPEGGIGKVNINRGTLDINNVTNLHTSEPMKIEADAYVENTAHAYLELNFRYDYPQYSMKGSIQPFTIPRLNPFITSYAPIRIKEGTSDGITFSGIVYNRYSSGTMKCLYHNLAFELEPQEKPDLKTIIKGLLAKTIIDNSNPPSPNQPARVVKYYVDRDMRTGFILMLVKSVLEGVQETLIMSKDNKQIYKITKEVAKKQEKEEKEEKEKRE